jgi:hypothetical protein
MTEYVVYHHPERMGYGALDVDLLSILTNKPTAAPVGSRVWLIAGQGRPRTYQLRGTFLIRDIRPSPNPEFHSSISGKDGRLLDPMPVLDKEPWFENFRKSQGNFAFGFQPISGEYHPPHRIPNPF